MVEAITMDIVTDTDIDILWVWKIWSRPLQIQAFLVLLQDISRMVNKITWILLTALLEYLAHSDHYIKVFRPF